MQSLLAEICGGDYPVPNMAKLAEMSEFSLFEGRGWCTRKSNILTISHPGCSVATPLVCGWFQGHGHLDMVHPLNYAKSETV